MDYTFDDSHKVMDLKLPEGVGIGDVEIAAQFLDRHGKPDPACGPMILKDKVPCAKDESCQPPATVEPTDGDNADAGSEAATNPGSEGATDSQEVGGADLEQAGAEPVKEEVAEAVVALSFDVPDMPAKPSEGPKVHHRPRVPARK